MSNAASVIPPTLHASTRAGTPLSDDDQCWLRIYMARVGIKAASSALMTPRSTLQSAAAGCGLRAGTIALLTARIGHARSGAR